MREVWSMSSSTYEMEEKHFFLSNVDCVFTLFNHAYAALLP
jgi:hypothetical protein